MGSARSAAAVRCTYCGGLGALVTADVRGVRYDYCDAACATAHRQAVELIRVLCAECDEEAAGDTGCCAEHLVPADVRCDGGEAAEGWRQAG